MKWIFWLFIIPVYTLPTIYISIIRWGTPDLWILQLWGALITIWGLWDLSLQRRGHTK